MSDLPLKRLAPDASCEGCPGDRAYTQRKEGIAFAVGTAVADRPPPAQIRAGPIRALGSYLGV